MEKMILWGAGKYGKHVKKQLAGKIEAIAYVDSDKQKWGGILDGISIRNPEWIKEAERGGKYPIIIAVANYYAVHKIIRKLHEYNIPSVYIAKPQLREENKEEYELEKMYQIDIQEKSVIVKLEVHVADQCNLNCKGCSHFSPILAPCFLEKDEFDKDLCKLSTIFSNVLRFRLMGGEPFLSSDLDYYITNVREKYPYANIEIVTNGLLLDSVKEKVWEAIRTNAAEVQISQYIPTFEKKEEISCLLKNKKVRFSFGSGLEQYNDLGIIDEFHKCLTLQKSHNALTASSKCFGKDCHFLRRGKISKCAVPLLIEDVNNHFHTEFEVLEQDYYDIYSNQKSSWEIADMLEQPMPFCKYCLDDYPKRFAWEKSSRAETKLEDFII